MMHQFFTRINNQSGYTMFLVLELIIIAMILFTISLHESYYVRTQAVREIHAVQARTLAQSGITKIEYFLNGNEGRSILWEGNNEVDSFPHFGTIKFSNSRFGLFSKLESSGTCIRTTCSVLGVAGRTMPDDCKPVLTLHGKVGSLALMEGSSIRGTVVLSHGRICKGNTTQEVKESGLVLKIQDAPTLPFDSSQAISAIKRLSDQYSVACSTKSDATHGLTLGTASSKDSVLLQDTISITGDCRIESGSHTNKTIISSGTVTVLSEAKCLLCRFSAKNIRIEGGSTDRCVFYSRKKLVIAGGTHNSQFFGEDSVIVGQKASYGPMSIVMLYRQGRADSCSAIFVEPKTKFNGTIISCSDTTARMVSRLSSIIFGKDCMLDGICLSDGDVDMNGITVKGHLWVRSIVTSDKQHGYVNFLFNTHLEAGDKQYPFPLVGKAPATIFVDKVATSVSVRRRVPKKERTLDTVSTNQSRSGK